MKFYPKDFEKIISNINSKQIHSILLHGPDSGVISDLVKNVSKRLNANLKNLSNIEPEEISSVLNNMNFFTSKEVVKISVKSFNLSETVKQAISKENLHFPIFIAGEIDPNDKFRKFFEKSANLASIGCYPDENFSIRKFLTVKLREANKMITPDALEFLCNNLYGNRGIIKTEIEKLILYKLDSKEINLEDCMSIISGSTISNADLLFIYFAKKETDKYLNELDKLIENEVSPVWILRTLARYLQNLVTIKICEGFGMGIEESMKMLKYKVFFKYLNDFKYICRNTTLSQASNMLEKVTKIELKYKKYFDSIVLDELFLMHFPKSK